MRELLEWAFSAECAAVDFGDGDLIASGRSMEARLLARAQLGGVRIDTSIGTSALADDAVIIASVVGAVLRPWQAVSVAEYARARRCPDPMIDAVPRVVPAATRRTRHGWRARVETIGRIEYKSRRGVVARNVDWCPIRYEPSPAVIAAARRAYLDWRGALLTIREALRHAGLERHTVAEALPPLRPWERTAASRASCGHMSHGAGVSAGRKEKALD